MASDSETPNNVEAKERTNFVELVMFDPEIGTPFVEEWNGEGVDKFEDKVVDTDPNDIISEGKDESVL